MPPWKKSVAMKLPGVPKLPGLTQVDVAYITAPEHLPYFVASMMESLRQGARRAADGSSPRRTDLLGRA